MREARLVGLSQDGKQLILAMAETGEEFAIPVDDRLRAALRGDRARLGQLEIQMESALRPRDIQARIRAGESPEAVAAVAQMPMERVMAFAGPVLAERDHIANLAQRASVRRRGGGDAPTRNLGAWVTDRLRIRQVDPATAEWDAWRRDDGRWAVRVSYFVEEDDEKVAMFAYDAPGRYAVPDDDEARWLVGEQVQVIAPPETRPGERRLTAVADFDLSLAPDHGADSYEAGFEDALSLSRDRDFGATGRAGSGTAGDFGRDDFGDRDRTRDGAPGREAFGREAVPGREGSRDEPARGPRRVHSVPSPDEEPTLIDVPIEQPPTLRPAVRAVERSAQLPVEAAPMAPPEERAAAPENRFTERRTPTPDHQSTPSNPAEAHTADSRTADARTAEARSADERAAEARSADTRAAEARATDTRAADARSAETRAEQGASAEARQATPKPGDPRKVVKPADPRQPALPTHAGPNQTSPGQTGSAGPGQGLPGEARSATAQSTTPGAAADSPEVAKEPTPAEPKKKPTKRGSKRASVPSWDEIMFGKKAD